VSPSAGSPPSGPVRVDRIARDVVVHGAVQGVFFRDSCRSAAQAAAVDGWVTNQPDGTVRARFEGPVGAVDQMVSWAHRGPSRARIERVEVSDAEPEGHSGFQVR